MDKGFSRRIFSPSLFFRDLGFLLSHPGRISSSMRDRQISKAFREKIMSVITAVNGCTYCTWFHAKQALSSGLSKEEVGKLFSLQFHEQAEEFELPALLYAQHVAETNRKPEEKMESRLDAFYGQETASHIRMIIRMIFFGNLYGNTFDAFLSRLKGKGAPNGYPLFEALFFLCNIPFLLPLLPFTKKYRNGK